MVAPFGVTILKYTVTISTFHFYLTIITRTFPSFNIIFNRLHKTLVWEKALHYLLVSLFRGLQPLRQQAG
ncbi:hypothetical protein ECNA114_026375 [Escherichia coli NA114]|nr:hypothetical protein ECNA114_026375 [Escherichia coli NA114]